MLIKIALNNMDKNGQCRCKICGNKIVEGEECKDCTKAKAKSTDHNHYR